ncbi:MAG: peptide ABC transporter ATP-binding protein [Anaerolineaceae bacterium]|nr:peptide ABC transporter ATP-binding protein [Anaerolineaceae bacterium]
MSNHLLEFRDVTKTFRIGGLIWGTQLTAVDHVNLSLAKDKPSILSVVGESGSGKTTLAKILLRLHEPTSGHVFIDGEDIFDSRSALHGKDYYRFVQPIFQNPFETFSMRKTVDNYLFDTALQLGIAKSRNKAQDVVAEALTSVGLDISTVRGKYPNQFSGGELQRISVARGLIPRPKLIVADEPVSMIDASLRMNIVNLFLELKENYGVSLIYITHDLSTAYYVSDYIAIMYRGNVVEYGPSDEILTNAAHPYTELLLDSVPTVGKKWERNLKPPELELAEYQAAACKFAERCPYVQPICREIKPPQVRITETRRALCYRPVDYQPGKTTVESEQIAVPE